MNSSAALGERFYSHRAKGRIFASPLNAPAEGNKCRQWFNADVAMFGHDLIPSLPQPRGCPRAPRRAPPASADDSWPYGLTGALPCSAAPRERARVWSEDATPGPAPGSLLFLECRRGLGRAAVQWDGKHVSPCWA